jgi:hypothetical protein
MQILLQYVAYFYTSHHLTFGWNSLGAALQAFLRADVNDVKNVSITLSCGSQTVQ